MLMQYLEILINIHVFLINIKYLFQGLNAIDAAIQCGVKHIIFNGSENVKKIIGKECNHLDSKSAIEEYIREVGKYMYGGAMKGACLSIVILHLKSF